MRAFRRIMPTILVFCLWFVVGVAGELTPPFAKKIAKELVTHGHVRIDPYFWLREKENPEVIAYLNAENEYADRRMAHTAALQEKLYQEMIGRIQETDMSVPYRWKDYFYYSRYEKGKQYPIYCRKNGSLEAQEEVMLDVNQVAEGHDFCSVGKWSVGPDQKILAYAVDYLGRRKYTIFFKNLETGEALDDQIPESTPNFEWANDNQTLFYTKQHPDTLRWRRVYRHVLGTDTAADVLVYEETDEEFNCGVEKTKSQSYIMIKSVQTLSSEYRFVSADTPTAECTVIQPREKNHEYQVDHFQDHFYIRTNDNATNFKLMKTPIDRTEQSNWREVVPHRDDVFLENFEVFKDHLAVIERGNALIQVRIMPWNGAGDHTLDFGEPAYTAAFGDNHEIDTPLLRYRYTSLTTPESIIDYDMNTRRKTVLKQTEVLGGFKKEEYATERLWATAEDGVKVPISIVYRDDFKRDGSRPLLLYGYGSYGISMNANFDSPRLSLLDRGFAYAIAHVRGGQELGRAWYENGKLLKKRNTFTDFIACAEYLIQEKYTSPDRLFATGGSAGGLLMGAVMNMRPDLFKGILAHVPWVDVVTTMLDESIPLTTSEYDEWGDPNDKEYYDYMLSYSPYDNVAEKEYPNLFVTTSLEDSQVQYWEPAKWVAKLRELKTDENLLLFKTEMAGDHGGVSGRYNRYKIDALYFAFMLDLMEMKE